MIVLLSLFLVFSVGKYFNNYYPYTNEFIAAKKHAYRYVGAGNLNFGQARYFLAGYLQAHPGVQMATEEPHTGQFILSIDDYLDVWNTGKYAWIRKMAPADHVFHSYLLFVVQQKDIDQ